MTVVGAGPVGLVLAAELALAGASVQVLERLAEPDDAMKAQSINVPTAEALDRRGLLPAGRRAPDSRFTGHFAGMVLDADLVDWSDPDLAAHTAADGARMLPQHELEALLAEHVARLGVPVRRGVEVTALDDTGDGVLVGTTARRGAHGMAGRMRRRAQRRASPRGHRLPRHRPRTHRLPGGRRHRRPGEARGRMDVVDRGRLPLRATARAGGHRGVRRPAGRSLRARSPSRSCRPACAGSRAPTSR